MIGIYKITNTINGKIYIGQSRNITQRWKSHIRELNTGSHHNSHLQHAWNKYGEQNFSFTVIEECKECELNAREQYYIELYDSRNTGYNLDNGGDGTSGYKHTQVELERMRAAHHCAVLLQFDLNRTLVRRWVGGIGQACKELRFTSECVRRRCVHTIREMSPYVNSYWIFEEEYNHPDFTWSKYLRNEKICDVDRGNSNAQKKVFQYTRSKELVKEWESLADVCRAGFNGRKVGCICRHYRGMKLHRDYIWTYDGYDFADGYFDSVLLSQDTNK